MNHYKTLHGWLIFLFFFLLITPAIVFPSLIAPFITSKAFIFRLVVSIGMVLWLFLILKNNRFAPSKTIVLLSGGVLMMWMAVSNIFGVDPYSSFFSNFERMEGWFTYFYLFSFLLIISSVIQKEKLWNLFFCFSTIIAHYVAIVGLRSGEERINAVLGNSTYLAIYMLFNIFFAIFLLYRIHTSQIKDTFLRYGGYTYFIYSILLFLYILLRTQTRGTIAALVLSVILFFILTTISHWKYKFVRILSISSLLIVILSSILFWQNKEGEFIKNQPILERISTISAIEGTGRSRIITWNIGIQSAFQAPILGWGQENYTYAFAQNYNPEMYDKESWFDRAHNAFLDWAVHHGFVGLGLYIIFLLSCVFVIYKSVSLTRIEKNLLYSVIFAYCIHNSFVFDSYTSQLLFFSIIGFIISHSGRDQIKISLSKQIQKIMIVLISLCIVALSYFTIFAPYSVASAVRSSIDMEDPNQIIQVYKKVFTKRTFGYHEATLQYFSLYPKFIKSNNDEVLQEYIEYAIEVGEKTLLYKPEDVRFLEIYGEFLMRTKNFPYAIEILKRAQSYAPNKQNNLYSLAIAYVENEEYEKAVEIFKHAYDVYPSNPHAQRYYGAALLLVGDMQGLEYVQGYSYKNPFFMSVFLKLKKYDEIVKIQKRIVQDDPEDYQKHVSLAAAYVLNNEREEAIKTIQFVQSKVPQFKLQGDQLIQDIRAGKSIGL